MFYKIKVKDFIRIPPEKFKLDLEEAMIVEIKSKYDGHISGELGTVIDVSGIDKINDGVIIPGDGANFYEAEFTLLTFLPEMQEVVLGTIKDIADFGAFISIGPAEGMIHISQTMNDFVSFNKEKTLLGKDTKRVLKVGDKCRARIISISYKDPSNPKLGLTMRQDGLGKEEWSNDQAVQKGKKKTKEE
ncbi:DNA-directed RNA polymerase [Candidatus Woesearchaeota archaeon CG10_big_fil_rev_8_21_14_0_10_32_9]|nr:MAG: DNA-directed RNA polymerase [Candidatus Woesearchaeota archaeon CG10_big_fil_rev_8_21_14_0_10_32_9]